uniref:Uncharacterized protein TCIL3000_5_2460 n=1 Tax=Trypanosoma congolense (strain IL3000) TaxID=1068625 RepID=G0UMX5_TRYCI|nr:unnamed protein product [Trypanosoma congolense IL3000]
MSDSSLVFLILNYGAEMIFILNARLTAQRVPEKTANAVLEDVIKHMYNADFMDKIFIPQVLYSFEATRELFACISQTSAMQMAPESMSKLFELMSTGAKYKFFSLRHPLELLELTWDHLEEVKRIATAEVHQFINPVFSRLNDLFQKLNVGTLAEVRKSLLNFLAGHSTPVSLLLEKGLQAPNGSFYLKEDKTLPPIAECEAPGVIRYYDNGTLISTRTFPHRDAELRHPLAFPIGKWNPRSPVAPRFTKRQVNLYAARQMEEKACHSPTLHKSRRSSQSKQSEPRSEVVEAMQLEMIHLQRLVRGSDNVQSKTFKWAVFEDVEEQQSALPQTLGNDVERLICKKSRPRPESPQPTITAVKCMSVDEVRKENEELLSIMKSLNVDSGLSKERRSSTEAATLLELMDDE